MPESANTIGKIAGSAAGAKILFAMCATVNATKRAMGVAMEERLTSDFEVTIYMA